MTFASVLGEIRDGGMHFNIIGDGQLNADGNPHNYPTSYGTHLKYGSYYAMHLLITNTGNQMWVSGTARDVIYPTTWHEVTLKT